MVSLEALVLSVLLPVGLGGPVVVPLDVDRCDELFEMLATVPHVSLVRSTGSFESIWDGATREGCELRFETNDSTLAGAMAPAFVAEPGSEVHARGWRMHPGILADGAGSGIHAIEKGDSLCVIRWEQPAYLDDDGEFVVSDTFTMSVQCSQAGDPRIADLPTARRASTTPSRRTTDPRRRSEPSRGRPRA